MRVRDGDGIRIRVGVGVQLQGQKLKQALRQRHVLGESSVWGVKGVRCKSTSSSYCVFEQVYSLPEPASPHLQTADS